MEDIDLHGACRIGEVNMRLFLTIEAQNTTESGLPEIMREVTNQLKFVTKKDVGLEDVDNYGNEFRLVAVIPSCMSKGFLNGLGWKERKLIWRKKKEADIRLFMDYESFIKESSEIKRLMYIDIIVRSIMVVKEKSKGDFRGDKLVNDILQVLDVTQEQLSNLVIGRV